MFTYRIFDTVFMSKVQNMLLKLIVCNVYRTDFSHNYLTHGVSKYHELYSYNYMILFVLSIHASSGFVFNMFLIYKEKGIMLVLLLLYNLLGRPW